MATELTGWAAAQILNAAMGHPMSTAMYEGLCAGNAQWPVRGVVEGDVPTTGPPAGEEYRT